MLIILAASGRVKCSSANVFVDGVKKSMFPLSVRMRIALRAGITVPILAVSP